MSTVIRRQYDPQLGFPAFVKQVVLTFPQISRRQRLVLAAPPHTPAWSLAQFFCTISYNVSAENVLETDSNSQQTPPAGPEPQFAKLNMLDATEQWLRKYGVDDPFASGFCFPSDIELSLERDLQISSSRMDDLAKVAKAWSFDSSKYTPNELLALQFILVKELLSDPEVDDRLQLSDGRLLWLLAVCRALYKPVVQYHSYFHCTDVTQCISLLIRERQTDLELQASQRLVLLLAAIGHDMLHPGLSTKFVVAINPRFRQRWPSLEAFHTHVFRQVLQQLWPAMAEHWSYILNEAIGATELARHPEYVRHSVPKSIKPLRLTFAHAIKISDFASCMRMDRDYYLYTSAAVFAEFTTESRLLKRMANDSSTMASAVQFFSSRSELEKPPATRFADGQKFFMQRFACPYFAWLSERDPLFLGPHQFCEYVFHFIEQSRSCGLPPPVMDLLEHMLALDSTVIVSD